MKDKHKPKQKLKQEDNSLTAGVVRVMREEGRIVFVCM